MRFAENLRHSRSLNWARLASDVDTAAEMEPQHYSGQDRTDAELESALAVGVSGGATILLCRCDQTSCKKPGAATAVTTAQRAWQMRATGLHRHPHRRLAQLI